MAPWAPRGTVQGDYNKATLALSNLPNVSCLTAPKSDAPCKTCLSTLKTEGKKNIRRNTSAVMRIEGGMGRRGWTLRGSIQKFIDVYASQATFTEVERSFPYMVAREYASGGGDIPEFKWHIFEDKVPIDVADSGVVITPFEVQHGRLWAAASPPAFAPTPTITTPSTPTKTPSTPKSGPSTSLLAPQAGPGLPSRRLPASADDGQGVPELYPYLCHAFKIQDSVIYLSDVSWISDESWAVINQPSVDNPSHRYAVAIVDCLRPIAHISHYGIKEAVNVARRINAQRTYLTGFGHEVSHEEYVTIGEYVGGKTIDNPTAMEKYCIDLVDEGKNIWLRPSHDGLQFEVSNEGAVIDNSYK
ncbi:hypothetical protein EI94DRAFT_1717135 [Lactarius quietus]|nr:hypothetical protein EI94DRAFT_1717135 [Lactarius quietus]